MAAKGFQQVRPTHRAGLVNQYRRLLGERKFWADRRHHPQAAPELARLDSAIAALAKALPLVAPTVVLAELKPLRFHLAVPLPGHALKRAVLAGRRKLSGPTLEELTGHIVEAQRIDLGLHEIGRLRQRVQKVLDGLVAKSGIPANTQEAINYFDGIAIRSRGSHRTP